jgi:tetratricopeptide (TPR) repeat protein
LRAFLSLACAVLIIATPAYGVSNRYKSNKQLEFGVKMALKGSWREAAFRFRKAAELDPKNAYAHNNLGVSLESTGQFEKAIEAYTLALELNPKNERMRENLDRLEAYMASRLFRSPPPGSGSDDTPAEESIPDESGGEGGS